MNWNLYPNFRKAEFDCKFTGKNEMRPEFLEVLQKIRIEFKRPMVITSGYRDVTHPIEARKAFKGTHALGIACDIAVSGSDAVDLVAIALKHGIRRIGVSQREGKPRFIHLDIGDKYGFNKSIWGY